MSKVKFEAEWFGFGPRSWGLKIGRVKDNWITVMNFSLSESEARTLAAHLTHASEMAEALEFYADADETDFWRDKQGETARAVLAKIKESK